MTAGGDKAALLDEAATLVAVHVATFGQTFLRAQRARDQVVDVSRLSVGREGDAARIRACFAYASEHSFLRQLFVTACEENIAGVPGSPAAERFATLAERLGELKVAPVRGSLHGISEARFRAEAVNPDGFDTEPVRLLGQVAATMRAVCLITNQSTGERGTGVLVAPHIVATAEHVVDGLVDPATGKARYGSAANLQIRLDVIAGLPGVPMDPLRIDEDWLIDRSPCPAAMLARDGARLPAESELDDLDDIVLIRLAEAPGFLRGWMELAEPDGRIDERRRGLTFHHHPGGADQKVSFGRHRCYYGPRFMHDCTSLGGSSGGPVLDSRGRMVGIHHGTVNRDAEAVNLGGGGKRLITWRTLHREAFEPPPASDPVWEIRKGGRAGSGAAVVGFEALQRRVRTLQHASGPRVLVVTGAINGGRVLFDVVEAMLPANQALAIRLDRTVLTTIMQTVAAQGGVQSQTTVAIRELAARIAPGVAAEPEKASADPAVAQSAAPVLTRALEALPPDRAVWVLVNIGAAEVATPLSEALAYLYKACTALPGGRGRLIVTGANREIGARVRAILGPLFDDAIAVATFEEPSVDDIARYLQRYATATQDPVLNVGLAVPRFAQSALAQARLTNATDFHAGLQTALATMTGQPALEEAA